MTLVTRRKKKRWRLSPERGGQKTGRRYPQKKSVEETTKPIIVPRSWEARKETGECLREGGPEKSVKREGPCWFTSRVSRNWGHESRGTSWGGTKVGTPTKASRSRTKTKQPPPQEKKPLKKLRVHPKVKNHEKKRK